MWTTSSPSFTLSVECDAKKGREKNCRAKSGARSEAPPAFERPFFFSRFLFLRHIRRTEIVIEIEIKIVTEIEIVRRRSLKIDLFFTKGRLFIP